MVAAVTGEVKLGEHTLRLGTRQLIALEARFDGKPAGDILASGSLTAICAIISVAAGISEDEAADLMDAVGPAAYGEALAEAAKAAFPDADGEASPRKAARQTG